MKYEFVPGYIRITEVPAENLCLIQDELTGTHYKAPASLGLFLTKLDGQHDPFDIAEPILGIDKYKMEALLASLIDDGIVRNVTTKLRDEYNSNLLPLWKPKRAFTSKATMLIAHIVYIFLVINLIPLNVLAVYLYSSSAWNASISIGWFLLLILALAIGVIMHEVGHAIAAISANIPVYEGGIILIGPIVFGAYVLIDDTECDSLLVRARIHAAGIIVNFTIGALLICIGVFANNHNIVLMGGIQYSLAISNLAPIEGLDGAALLNDITGNLDLPAFTKKVCNNKGLLKKVLREKEKEGILIVVIAYCIRITQIGLIAASILFVANM